MHIVSRYAIFIFIIFIFCSCYVHDISYPKKMIFPAEGGEVLKDFNLVDFEISDYNGNAVFIDSIGGTWTLDWLSAETLSATQSRIITQKNTSGKPRRLYLNRFEDPGFTEIMVIQLR